MSTTTVEGASRGRGVAIATSLACRASSCAPVTVPVATTCLTCRGWCRRRTSRSRRLQRPTRPLASSTGSASRERSPCWAACCALPCSRVSRQPTGVCAQRHTSSCAAQAASRTLRSAASAATRATAARPTVHTAPCVTRAVPSPTSCHAAVARRAGRRLLLPTSPATTTRLPTRSLGSFSGPSRPSPTCATATPLPSSRLPSTRRLTQLWGACCSSPTSSSCVRCATSTSVTTRSAWRTR
mmetsp:Transcript_15991/g.55808  ORF Transcript_15991/g.55808 Transcript_15991/m.55808 type:complete len:241 (+) Transcript_15991:4298-5020(+)